MRQRKEMTCDGCHETTRDDATAQQTETAVRGKWSVWLRFLCRETETTYTTTQTTEKSQSCYMYSLILSCLCILSTLRSLYWAWMVLQWPISSTNSLDKTACWRDGDAVITLQQFYFLLAQQLRLKNKSKDKLEQTQAVIFKPSGRYG